VAPLGLVRRLPQAALGTLDARKHVAARERQGIGGEVLAQLGIDLEDRHDVASFGQHGSPVLPAVNGT
jgi:hypothetical protein